MARKPTTRKTVNRGTVTERPRKGSGTWHAYLPPSMTEGKRVRVPGYWKSEEEARGALEDYIADLRNHRRDLPVTSQALRVSQAVELYIDYRSTSTKGRWATKTEEGYRAVLKRCVRHERANIGSLFLDRVNPPAVNKWFEDLAKAEVPESRIRYARWLLSGTFKWLITRGEYIGANPVGQVAAFWSKTDADDASQTRPVLLPTWQELSVMVQSPKFEQDRVLIAFLAWSGLRWSEAVSLRTTDIWPDRPMVTVARVLVWKQPKALPANADSLTGADLDDPGSDHDKPRGTLARGTRQGRPTGHRPATDTPVGRTDPPRRDSSRTGRVPAPGRKPALPRSALGAERRPDRAHQQPELDPGRVGSGADQGEDGR